MKRIKSDGLFFLCFCFCFLLGVSLSFLGFLKFKMVEKTLAKNLQLLAWQVGKLHLECKKVIKLFKRIMKKQLARQV